MSTVRGNGWSLEVSRELIDATPLSEPDPNWEYTDPAGHVHRYAPEGGVPTVEIVSLGVYWCPDCRDEHEDSEVRCRQCGALVDPGTRVPLTRQYAAGLTSISGSVDAGTPLFETLAREFETSVDAMVGPYWVEGVRATVLTNATVRFMANRLTYHGG